MHNDADISAETSDADGRWLTYDQLATLRRIDKPSAVKLATRNRWRRRKGNTGQMQVCVPVHWFERAQGRADRYTDKSPDKYADRADIGADTSLQAGALAALENAVATLREQLDVANARAERAEADRSDERRRADDLRDRLIAMQEQLADAHAVLQAAEAADARAGRAEVARAEEQARADALRAQIDALNAEMAATGAAADRAMADERMRADRLSAQVEALSAEVLRADAAGRDKERAEADRDAERARANALRERTEALQEQLAARPEGVDAAEAIRRAEAMVDSLREAHAGEVGALKAERHRLATQIDGFATRADQAEARTDSLRGRVDVLQRERDTARADAERSGAEAKEAHAEADAMWQAEEARKARGRWTRLKAAWRGE
jgi:chromosome segregation ATPase